MLAWHGNKLPCSCEEKVREIPKTAVFHELEPV